MIFLSLVFLSLISSPSAAVKVLVYSPSIGVSHTNFMARLADTLTLAGHDVTFLIPVVAGAKVSQLGVRETKDVVIVEPAGQLKTSDSKIEEEDLAQYWTTIIDSSNAEEMFKVFDEAIVDACDTFLSNKTVAADLKTRNFDVAIVEPLSVCGVGYAYALGVPNTILASSCAVYDGAVGVLGEPLDLSFVPSMMGTGGEKMTFFERLENWRMGRVMVRTQFAMWDREMAIYRRHLGEDVPDWRDLLPAASVSFTNSIPYVDFPRGVTQKTVPIGGITVDLERVKEQKLSMDWSKVLDERPRSILISFGSMIRSMDMPKEWRSTILEAIASEPNVTFIWKYESEDVQWARSTRNVHFSKWLPQTALLNDNRLTAFMTHGGLGSTNELAFLGKPALMVPVFGDQDRNANMLARHGGVLVLRKDHLSRVEVVRDSIREILYNGKYGENARKLAHLLADQPTKPKDLVVQYTQFVAKHGPFPAMDPFGRQLGFVERYFLDVYLFISIPYLFVFLVICMVRLVWL